MVLQPTPDSIARAAHALRAGALVAFPTETVYGLGADARNQDAVKQIFAVKGRPFEDPLIVHIASLFEVETVADLSSFPEATTRLEKLAPLWPGPLTVVLPKAASIAPAVSAGLNTVAVRIPSHPIALELLKTCAIPVAAPSANPFSYVSPTCAQHVEQLLGNRVEIILDGGACQVGIESTILSLAGETPTILRPGVVTAQQLREILGTVHERPRSGAPLLAPGMLDRHYSPRTAVRFYGELALADLPKRVGLIRFISDMRASEYPYSAVTTLSQSGSLEEVARNLFAVLREHDELGLELILIDRCVEDGIGAAIMDRVRKAIGHS